MGKRTPTQHSRDGMNKALRLPTFRLWPKMRNQEMSADPRAYVHELLKNDLSVL